MAEKLPITIEVRTPEESCSQYVFGPKSQHVDVAFKQIIEGKKHRSVQPPLQKGDIIFYKNFGPDVSHVATIGENGNVISKFMGDPNVYEHELWGEPIPQSVSFESCVVFRLLPQTTSE